jgi:hypothetical protein
MKGLSERFSEGSAIEGSFGNDLTLNAGMTLCLVYLRTKSALSSMSVVLAARAFTGILIVVYMTDLEWLLKAMGI